MKKTILLSLILFGFFTTTIAQDSTAFKVRATSMVGGKGKAASFLEVTTPLGSNLRIDTNFTIECWVYLDKANATKTYNLVEAHGTEGGFAISIENQSLRAQIFNNDNDVINGSHWVGENDTIPSNGWVHIAVSFNVEKREFQRFINGRGFKQIGGGIKPRLALVRNNNDYIRIGGDGNDGFAQADFQIDEVRIWKHERTATEIGENYNKCLQGAQPNLLASYTFEDISKLDSIVDQSGNGNLGKLTSVPEQARLVSGASGCTSEAVTTGVFDMAKRTSTLSVYPNPTSGSLTLNTDIKIEQIKVIDLTGKVVLDISPTNNQINVSNLQPGIYTLQAISNKGTSSLSRFIKN